MPILRKSKSLAIGAAMLAVASAISAQSPLTAEDDMSASDSRITPPQQVHAGMDHVVANNIKVALNFERSRFSNGSVDDEPFYRLPSNASDAAPGALLKLQISANTSAYTLPPNTALSRILYQSRTLNGTAVPASAFILWPYTPRVEHDGYPVVGWAHGTSGGFGNCAPSHIRNLWYQFTAPYTLALQGYVVVATDYVGLGVNRDFDGEEIRHTYLANIAHANDMFYSVQAAQTAFTSLSKRFVMMGHSQGGGAAWAAARRQVEEPVHGYLGTIAAAPVTNVGRLLDRSGGMAGDTVLLLANSIPAIFPSFNASDFLTPAGLAYFALIRETQGCNSVTQSVFADPTLAQPMWYHTPFARAYIDLTKNEDQPISGPMLVLQGENDASVLSPVTDIVVNLTCAAHPQSKIHYLTYPEVEHLEVMYAAQRTWLEWIADRFAGKEVEDGCQQERIASARPYGEYQSSVNWFIEYATQAYQLA